MSNIDLSGAVSTKNMLTANNFKIWEQDITLLLSIHDVEDHIQSDLLETITKEDIAKISGEKVSNYKQVKNSKNLYYKNKDITDDTIKNDKVAKFLLNNSISNDIKIKLNFKECTAYQIWCIIKGGRVKSNAERKLEIKEELDLMKYDAGKDISMFLSEMDNLFDELSKLGEKYTDEQKFNQLYTSLPYDIVIESNIISYQGKWKETKKHLIGTIPLLKFLKNMKTNKPGNNVANLSYGKPKPKNNKIKKCSICNKIGHTEQQCWHNKANNKSSKHSKYIKNYRKNNNNTKKSKKAYNAEIANEDDDSHSQEEYEQNFINDYESSEDEQSNFVMAKTIKPRHSNKHENHKRM